MARALRHDRSQILYPDLQATAQASRRDRYLSILSLRAARAAYHVLTESGGLVDPAGEQLRWTLRALAAGLGFRLIVLGTSDEETEPPRVN